MLSLVKLGDDVAAYSAIKAMTTAVKPAALLPTAAVCSSAAAMRQELFRVSAASPRTPHSLELFATRKSTHANRP